MTTESLLSIISKDYPCMSCPLHPSDENDIYTYDYYNGNCPFIHERVKLEDAAIPDGVSFKSVQSSLATDRRCPLIDRYYLNSLPSQNAIKDLVSKTDFNYESAQKIVAAVAVRMREIDKSLVSTSYGEPDGKVAILSSALNELQLYSIINRLDYECILDAYSSNRRFIDIKHLCDVNGFQYSRLEEGRITKYIETEEIYNEQFEVVLIKHVSCNGSIALIPQHIISDGYFQNILPAISLPDEKQVERILLKKELEKLVPDFLDENLQWKKGASENCRIMANFTTRIGENIGWSYLDKIVGPIVGIKQQTLTKGRYESTTEDERKKIEETLEKYFPKVSTETSSSTCSKKKMKVKNFQGLIELLKQ